MSIDIDIASLALSRVCGYEPEEWREFFLDFSTKSIVQPAECCGNCYHNGCGICGERRKTVDDTEVCSRFQPRAK